MCSQFWWLVCSIASLVVASGPALADSGVAPAVVPKQHPSPLGIVRLMPNTNIGMHQSATVSIVWRYSADVLCMEGQSGRVEGSIYCVEIEAESVPVRCTITTPRQLRHSLLGAAVQHCFKLGQHIASR